MAPERTALFRAPLFLPALCLGAGCWLGGFPGPSLSFFVFAALVGLIFWKLTAGRTAGIAFAVVCIAVGVLSLRLPEQYPDPRELTGLSAAKFGNPVWEGRIAGVPQIGRSQVRFIFSVKRWKDGEVWRPAHGRVEVRVLGTDRSWQYGQQVRLAGPLQVPPLPDAPGRFNARTFLSGQGIFYQMILSDQDATRLSPAGGPIAAFGKAVAAVREWGVAELGKGLEDDPLSAQLLAGIVLGQRHLVPPMTLFFFRTAGAYHLFSANGGDVALLLGVALAALRLCGLIRWRWGWAAAPLLLFYALLAGGQPSVLRGLTAATVVLGAWWVGRPMPALQLWGLTLLIVLAVDPRAATDLGFQFSFLVVLSMILFTPILRPILVRPFALDAFIPLRVATPGQRGRARINRYGSALLAACAAAWIGSVGLELAYFHQLCLTAIPVNFIGVPLTALIFGVGLLTLAGAAFLPGWAVLLNNANWLFVKLLLAVVLAFAHLPWASIYLPLGKAAHGPDPEFTVASAGRGTSILLRYGKQNWLINPGNPYAFFYDADPTRKYLGVNRLDGVITAEWSAASAGAAPLLPFLLRTGPGFAPPPGPLSHAGPWALAWHPAVWTVGDRYDFGGGLSARVLSPDLVSPARQAADRGLVLLFEYRGARFLYAGRVGFGIESEILSRFPDLKANVLVEGPHATEINLTPEWLAGVAPQDLILTGSGDDARMHRHPLDGLPEETKSRLWNISEEGAMRVILHGDGRTTVAPWN